MSPDDWLFLLATPATVPSLGWARLVLLLALVLTCGVIVVVDARERIIPDLCNLTVAALGLAAAGFDGRDALFGAVAQGIVVYGVFWLFRAAYRRLRGHHGLGLGDVKFLGAAGAWIGLGGVPPMILIASLSALAWLAVVRIRGGGVSAGTAIPFGPFLVVGLLGVLAAGLL